VAVEVGVGPHGQQEVVASVAEAAAEEVALEAEAAISEVAGAKVPEVVGVRAAVAGAHMTPPLGRQVAEDPQEEEVEVEVWAAAVEVV